MVPRLANRVVPFLVFAWIATALAGVAAGASGAEPLALNPNPPATPQKLIFIHHSTGGNWLADPAENSVGGDLGRALMNNNYYVSATNYDWGPEGIGSVAAFVREYRQRPRQVITTVFVVTGKTGQQITAVWDAARAVADARSTA